MIFDWLFQGVAGARAGTYYASAAVTAAEFDTTNFSEDTKRQLSYLDSVGLPADEARELNDILGEMSRIYGSYQVIIILYYSLNFIDFS